MSTLSESDYAARASAELARLLEAFDELGEAVEAELSNDILSVEFADRVRFVINSHRAARQIWMAAGSKAWHFDFDLEQNRWVASKTGDELWTLLRELLQQKLGGAVAFG